MLKIRLKRIGRKNRPFYRIVVAEAKCAPSGKFVEILGNFNPRDKKNTLSLKKERIKYWLSQGAIASPIVHNLLVDQDIITEPKKKATRVRKKQDKEESKAEAKKDSVEKIKQKQETV